MQIVELFDGATFSGSTTWKPVQAGIKLSTTSVLDLHGNLMSSSETRFLLTSRLNQDALENVFSQVRGKGDSHPSIVAFRYNLRCVCLSQFMTVPKTAAYHADATPHLLEFIRKPKRVSAAATVSDTDSGVIDALVGSDSAAVDFIDQNVIAYVSGWLSFKIKTLLKDCHECCSSIVAGSADKPELQLIAIKSLGGLCVPSTAVVQLISAAEIIFRRLQPLLAKSSNVERLLVQSTVENISSDVTFPTCHGVRDLLLCRYVKLRLHAHAASLSRGAAKRQFASKSAAARTTVV